MLESHHHTLFYPQREKELLEATRPRTSEFYLTTLPSAILCPHASYTYAQDALHSSFAPARNLKPELVVFLGPLHQEVLKSDEPAFLVGTMSEGIRIGDQEYGFAPTLMEKLLDQYPEHLTAEDSYFEEEPALELTLPFIESYLGDVPVLPLLCGSASSKQIAHYTKLLMTILTKKPSTLFIVSANANALLPSPQAETHATSFIESLTTAQSFLSQMVSSCNRTSLEAISQVSDLNRKWGITALFCKGKEYEQIQNFPDTNEKHVWQISAHLGATDDQV